MRIPSNLAEERIKIDPRDNDDMEEVMKSKDIYKELRLRGYQYTGLFRALQSASTTGSQGHIAWVNWVPFMDSMLQMKILGTDTRNLYVPTSIRKVVIDTKRHAQNLRSLTASPAGDKRKLANTYI